MNSRVALLQKVLAGSWRRPPFPPLELSETQLDEVTPLIYGSSAGALGWWRIRETPLTSARSADVLRQAYRLHSVQSVMHEEKIVKSFRLLREASIEAVLAKGWAATVFYPVPPLRPYHDIDIFVRPKDFKAARELFDSPDANDCWVDLHDRFYELSDRDQDHVFARSKTVSLYGEPIRILGAEDQLALLAVHLLKHGAWRPLWLCDIGAAIESLPEDFDWDVCLGHKRTHQNWVTSAIGLAHRLLEARIDALPVAREARNLPAWLAENVLAQWATPFPLSQTPAIHPEPMISYLRRPSGLLTGLRKRWPNPIIATISVNGRFNSVPRFPYQVGNCLWRTALFIASLPRSARANQG